MKRGIPLLPTSREITFSQGLEAKVKEADFEANE
jgi:hypothetical protein